jgi:homoserine O-acetyltransferase/O-succinyltransferase
MRVSSLLRIATAGAALSLIALAARAADYPAPREGDWTVKDFKFHTGEILPELRLHYTTVGDPKGEPVVVLHGTSPSMRASTTSFSRTRSVTASRPSRRTD